MHRSLPLLLLACLAVSAQAFDRSPRKGDRIGILSYRVAHDERRRLDEYAAGVVRGTLLKELRARGFDAFAVRASMDDLPPDQQAHYYVDFAAAEGDAYPLGGFGAGGEHAGVEMGVVLARVAGVLRIYEGRTLERIETFALQKRKTSFVPAIAIGGRHVHAWVAAPFMQFAGYRSAAKAIAREAAEIIEGAPEEP